MDSSKQDYINQLINLLEACFNRDELKMLAFKLGLEELQGNSKTDCIITLIKYLEHRQQLSDLITLCQQERPKTTWLLSPELKQAQTKQRLTDLRTRLILHVASIGAILIKINTRLKIMEENGIDAEAEVILEVIESFLAQTITAEGFMQFWANLEIQAANREETLDYTALAKRLQGGNIVVFLGLDVATLFGYPLPSSSDMVATLAQHTDYIGFRGGLSEVCEYLQINHRYGQDSLLDELERLITPSATSATAIVLYELLATILTPLVLISAGYDTLLEDAFTQHHKPFVLISHPYHYAQGNGMLLRVSYSDQSQPEFCLAEQFSEFQVIEKGYSLIYKIRGSLSQKECLVLSEQDYLAFAKTIDQLIPDYVVNQLFERGFWFLGHPLMTWEDRLLMRLILEKRSQIRRPEPALFIHKHDMQADRFVRAYWDHNGVKNYPVDLKEFVAQLQRYF